MITHQYRKESRGGVALLVRNSIKLTKTQQPCDPYTSGKFMHCNLSMNNIHFDIVVVYRMPSFNIEPFTSDLF